MTEIVPQVRLRFQIRSIVPLVVPFPEHLDQSMFDREFITMCRLHHDSPFRFIRLYEHLLKEALLRFLKSLELFFFQIDNFVQFSEEFTDFELFRIFWNVQIHTI